MSLKDNLLTIQNQNTQLASISKNSKTFKQLNVTTLKKTLYR